MDTTAWVKYSPQHQFDFSGDKLAQQWSRLHRVDDEPFPDSAYVERFLRQSPLVLSSINLSEQSSQYLSEQLQQAWRLFHSGDYPEAFRLGESLGLLGAVVSNLSATMYATHLVTSPKEQQRIYKEIAARCAKASAVLPEQTNLIYFEGCAWGLYSQSISLLKAAAEGIATKFSGALEKTLDRNPDHVLANLGYAIFHAEVVHTVGSMVAKVTYGASKKNSELHMERVLGLAGDIPIVTTECGKNQILLYGKKGKKKAQELLDRAASLTPVDAMEELDIIAARNIKL